jgi:hypothetical protein
MERAFSSGRFGSSRFGSGYFDPSNLDSNHSNEATPMSVENGLADVQSFKSDSQQDLGHIQQGHELPPPANGNRVSSEGGTISKATLQVRVAHNYSHFVDFKRFDTVHGLFSVMLWILLSDK